MPYPFQRKPGANAAWDDTPDWATGPFPEFEKAVNSGALMSRSAAWDGGGEMIKTAGRKEPSALDNLGQYAIDNYGASQEEAEEFKGFVFRYGLRNPRDAWALRNLDKNKPGTVTLEQDRALRKSFEDKGNRLGPKAREDYNAAIASRKLRVIP